MNINPDNEYDAIVVGSGFAGSVIANELAQRNKKVLIIEKRPNIGGNMYEEVGENGIRIHKYGPHIFHTNSTKVFEYIKKYGEWRFYEHTVLGDIDGKLVPIPFNFRSIESMFDADKAHHIENKLTKYFSGLDRVSILDLISHTDKTVKEFGDYVYEKVFANYTAKQWGVDIKDIDKSIIERVPVTLGYDNRYFRDKYQFMPKNGYNEIFDNLLKSPNITVVLNCDAKEYISIKEDKVYFNNEEFTGKLVYTGQIDELFDYEYGKLAYRSLRFEFSNHNIDHFQVGPVVNYPNSHKFTRITEFKYLTGQKSKNTTIVKEYPQLYNGNNIPYYPIIDKYNSDLYDKYKNKVINIRNLYLCGRLAEYKYYNMDQAILKAIETAEEIE
jgi:UDP-galactopyranose mutase